MPGCLCVAAALTTLTMALAASSSAPAQDDEGNGLHGAGKAGVGRLWEGMGRKGRI